MTRSIGRVDGLRKARAGAACALFVVTSPGAAMAAEAGPVAPPSTSDAASFEVRIRDLEARVEEMKASIQRIGCRMPSMTFGAGGLEIVVENQLPGEFSVVRATVVLDGAVAYSLADAHGLPETSVPAFRGPISYGEHTLEVAFGVEGAGFGVLTYMKSFHLAMTDHLTFSPAEGKNLRLTVTAYDRGGVTAALSERPAFAFREWIEAPPAPLSPAR